MAEASVDRPRFFCHKCSAEIRPVLPDFVCPQCDGGFIEELENDSSTDHSDGSSHPADDRGVSFEAENDPFQTFVFSTLFSDMMNEAPGNNASRRPNVVGSPSSSSPPTSSSSSLGGGAQSSSTQSNRNPGATDSNRTFAMHAPGTRTTLRIHGGPRGATPPDMIAFLQQFLGLAPPPPGPGGVHFPVQMFNMHGSPRDYAWGEGGLDQIITQLLNNADGHGPPPATEVDIRRLEMITINNIHIEQSADCPVCMEAFKGDEAAKRLPCTHFFHPKCVETWLEMHNTCPVCRKSINEESAPGDSASNSNAR
ncbi:E3 ubiquitin-protein ligase RNF126 [Strongylocentrotus purpuratus]|uniref:RING-type E3 ubiquitin transferase n=1 Tax=Strongylocentrotus purpuratus TaxID=7668 RepID=A0A7M7LWQ7_STRPU|nr:E3 ubiquitin-protein ligase RNF126 [Strongylocentrotus purpuratus]|eukprot:XP_011683664.1 PREDICTED: E3 ubiquitin-protein ligase RNF126 isoform X2 [Strongylocentrotus purpuratus]